MAMSDKAGAITEGYAHKLKENLEDNILRFWFPKSVDDDYGGFLLNYDSDGAFTGDSKKMIVTQARMTWFFSRLHRENYGSGEFLQAAETGFEFLAEQMWDDEFGGFYWEVDRAGGVQKPNKHLYGQAFGLYALSEYYRASSEDKAKSLAIDLFNTVESEAKDSEYGGYTEFFQPDWTPIESGRTYLSTIEPDWSTKEMTDDSLDPTYKLTNTHLHLLESFTTFHEAIGTETSEQRLQELLHILTNTVIRPRLPATTDKYSPEWVPKLNAEFSTVSYGHDLENIWLTMEAAKALDISVYLFRDLYERIFEYALEYGYDHQNGGFFFYGPFNNNAINRIKAWWVQAECMTSALKMYTCTGNQHYLKIFTETYDFIHTHQVDWETGEWHSGINEKLEPVGRKGAEYKGAYHNGRAMLECINILEEL